MKRIIVVRRAVIAVTATVVAGNLHGGAAGQVTRPRTGAVPQGVAAGATRPAWAPADPAFVPIGVWLPDSANVVAYPAIGINVFIGLWQGPTEAQLDALRAVNMPVIADQNAVGLAHLDDPMLAGCLLHAPPKRGR